ncbi:hypothetical protein U1Q18_033764 [Sarracenia purpurea var. burkii]
MLIALRAAKTSRETQTTVEIPIGNQSRDPDNGRDPDRKPIARSRPWSRPDRRTVVRSRTRSENPYHDLNHGSQSQTVSTEHIDTRFEEP